MFRLLLIVVIFGAGLSSATSTAGLLEFPVFYFPDPKNASGLLPAYLTGEQPSIDVTDNSTIKFYLFTRNAAGGRQYEEIIPYDLGSINDSPFIPKAPLKIMSHGFGGSYKDGFPLRIAEAFLDLKVDMNIILIDWEIYATSPWYIRAFNASKLVGDTAGNLIKFLVEQDLVTLDQVHAIGYSLGGEVVGNIGSALGGQAARITSLDPALPLFDIVGDELRIDPSDGKFVEVIHSAGGHLHESGLAWMEPRGHADFYPNDGRHQPGCEQEVFGSCSHPRAPDLYEESIRNKDSVLSCSCSSWSRFLAGRCDCSQPLYVGMNTPTTARGKYFFLTNDKRPLGLGTDGLVNYEKCECTAGSA